MTREEAIEYLNTLYMALAVFPNQQISLGNVDEMKESVSMAIKALEQEPKTGHWKRIGYDIYECSICGQDVMTGDICAYRHCHGCGAKMESEES